MKICILSMQKVNNFGSLLQGYSLKKILQNLGHEISFIDIEPDENHNVLMSNHIQHFGNEKEKSRGSLSKLRRLDKYWLNRLQIKKRAGEQNRLFEDFRRAELGITGLENSEYYDVCVIGSDEVFNCSSDTPWGFTSQLFGNVRQADKVITYAASCGATSIDNISVEARQVIKNTFNKVSAFSVRDENTKKFVESFDGDNIYMNYDPVVVGDFDDEISNADEVTDLPERFCIVYSYYNRIHDKDEIKKIKEFCSKRQLEIVTVGAPQMWVKNHLVLKPFEMLSVFKKADFVITDTFHGTIFSAKYAKRFAVMTRASNYNKLSDLIEKLNVSQHCIKDWGYLEQAYSVLNDIEKMKKIYNEQYKKTVEYLKKYI